MHAYTMRSSGSLEAAHYQSMEQPRSRRLRTCTLLNLLLVVWVDFLDRAIFTLVAQPIKEDLNLSDTQLGSLVTAFTLFEALAIPPISLLVERSSDRRRPLVVAMLVWTLFSALSGAAQSYEQLLACRVMVGVGEATVAPIAMPLLADLYGAHERSTPFGVYLGGTFLGTFLGNTLGGLVASLSSWRLAFVLVSSPGLLVAASVFARVVDPRTEPGGGPPKVGGAPPQLGSTLRALWAVDGLPGVLVAVALQSAANLGVWAFLAPYLQRAHGLTTAQAGAVLALTNGIAPFLALVAGGVATDAIAARTSASSRQWVLLLLPTLSLPTSLLFMAVFLRVDAAHTAAAAAALCAWVMLSQLSSPAVSSVVMELAPQGTRSIAFSVSVLFSAVGIGSGALLVGALSDAFGPGGLAPAMGVANAALGLLSTAVYVALVLRLASLGGSAAGRASSPREQGVRTVHGALL